MTTATLTQRQEDALHFVQTFGLPIFPCSPDKRPLIKGWQQAATTERKVILEWWSQWPHALIGCPTGGGFWVTDLDMKKGQNGIQAFKDLAREQQPGLGLLEKLWPDTTVVRTPTGGVHLWWIYPEGIHISNSVRSLGPGIDVRGDGGYVIVPARGSGYEWQAERPAAEAPQWLLDLVTSVKPSGSGPGLGGEAEEIAEGERNDRLFRIGASLRGRGLSQEGIRAALLAENETRCKPPLGPAEVETIAQQAGQYPPGIEEREPPPPGAATEKNDEEAEAKPAAFKGGKTRLDSFIAFPPENKFLHLPTQTWWSKEGVSAHLKPVPVGPNKEIKAATWLMRFKAVQQVSWLPGEPQVVEDRGFDGAGQWQDMPGHRVLNTWQPAAALPGDPRLAGPWLEHLQAIYPGEWEHILFWLAHRVQRPGEKINHAIVLGGSPGIGKDTLLEPVTAAVGPRNTREITPIIAEGIFNGFVESVLLRVSESRDQQSSVNRFSLYEHMKPLTAAPPAWLEVHRKYREPYSVPNCVGIVYTTNYSTDCLYLPADDRRHFVAWSPVEGDAAWSYRLGRLWDWYAEGGIGHVAAYLRSLDISSFNPKSPPPKTRAFKAVALAQGTSEDLALADLLEDLRWPLVFNVSYLRSMAERLNHLDVVEQLSGRNRSLAHRLGRLRYSPCLNPARTDGRWDLEGIRQIVYAKQGGDQAQAREMIEAMRYVGENF